MIFPWGTGEDRPVDMRRLSRLLKPAAALLAVALVLFLLPIRRVGSNEMAWTLQQGDLVWILPQRISRGDIVLLADPLDPDRRILRRAVAAAGQKVRYEEGTIRINGKRIRQQDMGKDGEFRIMKEVIWSSPPARPNPYLVRLKLKPVKWAIDGKVEVPDGHWYLMADDRNQALDSRWWGPIPEDQILGVVRLRVSQKDEWRPEFELHLPEE